jgi:SulP family sulfate permease
MSKFALIARKYLPVLEWGTSYTKSAFTNDLLVAIIVTLMLIPQSLAYAQLAGLPPEVGLYASMVPLLLYAVFGTSRALAVGPVAVVSLMTATAIAPLVATGSPQYLAAAMALALLSGVMLIILGVLRLGFMANFLSHPVISGFITASGIQIAASQLNPLLGIPAKGETFFELAISLAENVSGINWYTASIGVPVLAFLFIMRAHLAPTLRRLGVKPQLASMLTRMGPVVAIIFTIVVVAIFELQAHGVRIVGEVPQGLPSLAFPGFDGALWKALLMPALLISVVGYVESISVAQTLASKKRQRIDPNQELIALGAANVGAAVSGGYPVTGGFARSVVNFDAGAETPAAGAFTAIGIALATLFLTPYLFFLPNATLAATIIVAVLSLVNLKAIKHTYSYSPADAAAMVATILITLVLGIEAGLIAGVLLSLLIHLYRTSKPHFAIVGQVPGTEHFRNVNRHTVVTDPAIVSVRIDESLYFPNARFLEDLVNQCVAKNPEVKHLILMCSAVNSIDASALESLEAINLRLKDSGIAFHLSEVKGPIADRLLKSHLAEQLTGKIHLTHYDAVASINPELAQQTLLQARKNS